VRRALGGMFVAEDLLRLPEIATFDLRGNASRLLGFLTMYRITAGDLASSSNNT
jgi:hypothetical protein